MADDIGLPPASWQPEPGDAASSLRSGVGRRCNVAFSLRQAPARRRIDLLHLDSITTPGRQPRIIMTLQPRNDARRFGDGAMMWQAMPPGRSRVMAMSNRLC